MDDRPLPQHLPDPDHRSLRLWRDATPARRLLARAAALITSLLISISIPACSDGDDVDAPPVPAVDTRCPSIDATLAKTNQALAEGRLSSLRALVVDLQAARGGALISGALRSLLLLLRAIPPEIGAAVDFGAVKGLLTQIEPVLQNVLTPFAALDPAVPADRDRLLVFDALGEVIETCEEGSLTSVVQLLTGDPELLKALSASLKDPTIINLIASLPAPTGSDSSRQGFAVLIDTVIQATLSSNFVFDDLIALIEPFFPTDEPPLSNLLPPLSRLLSGANLDTLRTFSTCLLDTERTTSDGTPTRATLLLGGLLYDLFAEESVSVAGLIEALLPIFERITDPALLALLDTVIEVIGTEPELRRDLIALIVFALDVDRVPVALDGVAVMLDVGTLGELFTLVENLFVEGSTCGEVEIGVEGMGLRLGASMLGVRP